MFLRFGGSDPGARCLTDGWSAPERHFVWAVGLSSKLLMPRPSPSAFGHALHIQAHPFAPEGHAQALRVICNGHDLGEHELVGEAGLTILLGAEVTQGRGRTEMEFVARHAISPVSLGLGEDGRPLSFALFALRFTPPPRALDCIAPPVDGVEDRDVMTSFESLAEDCEFGFAQRAAGAEPIGLLRWGGIRAHVLDEALSRRFEGIDDPDAIEVAIQGNAARGEYMIVQKRYRYAYHTFVNSWDMTPEALLARELTRLTYGRRRLLEDLAEGRKLFVVKSSEGGGLRFDQAAPLAELIASYGGGVLFWVVAADELNPPGLVRWRGPHLLEGRIDRLCEPGEAASDHSPLWLPLCRAAYRAMVPRRAAAG